MNATHILISKLPNRYINSYSIVNASYGVLRLCAITVSLVYETVRYSMVVSRFEGGYLISGYLENDRIYSRKLTSLRSVRMELGSFIAYVTGIK